jgi:hypothetical protein
MLSTAIVTAFIGVNVPVWSHIVAYKYKVSKFGVHKSVTHIHCQLNAKLQDSFSQPNGHQLCVFIFSSIIFLKTITDFSFST